MAEPTFDCPDLDAFCLFDRLGMSVTGQHGSGWCGPGVSDRGGVILFGCGSPTGQARGATVGGVVMIVLGVLVALGGLSSSAGVAGSV